MILEKVYGRRAWRCPRKDCDNANVAGCFKCAGCGLDGLKFGRCSRKLKEKGWMPCGNKQVLLLSECLKCGAKLSMGK